MQEMRTAEASSSFDYDPNWTPGSPIASIPITAAELSISPPVVKRKNSLDDFELEIDGMNLDDNIDTSVRSVNATLIRINTNSIFQNRT